MNKSLDNIISEIDTLFKCVQIDFKDNTWKKSVPTQPGWYLIETNTPIKFLKSVEIFSLLSDEEIQMILENLKYIEKPAGEVLFNEGDCGQELFIVKKEAKLRLLGRLLAIRARIISVCHIWNRH